MPVRLCYWLMPVRPNKHLPYHLQAVQRVIESNDSRKHDGVSLDRITVRTQLYPEDRSVFPHHLVQRESELCGMEVPCREFGLSHMSSGMAAAVVAAYCQK